MKAKGAETRARIVAELADGSAGARWLASRLSMTTNAVRLQLKALQAEGKVRDVGTDYRAVWELTESDGCGIL